MTRRRRPALLRRPASMRGRLTLLTAVSALLSLSVAAVISVLATRDHLFKEAHEYAKKAANAVEAKARKAGPDPYPVPDSLIADPRLEVHTYTWSEVDSLERERPGTTRISLGRDQEAPSWLSLRPWTDPAGRTPVPEAVLRLSTDDDYPVLVVFSPLRAEQAGLNAVVWSVAGSVVTVTALMAAVAWYVAGRVLRPVEDIRSRFADLTAHHLDRRVPVPRTDDEVARLARTMNTTLDRLEANVDQQRRFVADASHELRSPLTALRAELEIALAHPEGTDLRDVVEAALGDTRRLQHLTTDLLLLARLDVSGAVHLPGGGPVDLAALVRDEAARFRAPQHLVLRVETAGEPVPVHGQYALLTRLLGNLLDNARRYAVRTVEIGLVHDPAARRAVLHVQDDGPGIAPADRQRVFDRFTRLDDARARDTGGAGLGLAIAHRIASAHHGTLEIADSPRGARFAAVLPTAAGEETTGHSRNPA
ncbi:HAMP domain-containing sensor histidine kinase [Streptomyces nondiastaticus]|uniref:sensor histidine kinase n=1 Tax=Streptomyces nondiastaticus TaxID=3154512 RepID=UPI00343DFA93